MPKGQRNSYHLLPKRHVYSEQRGPTNGVKKRRLRKKRRLGEFREDIFRIRIKLKASLPRNEAEDWDWDVLIPQVEKLHLGVGGGSRWRPDGVVCNFHVQSRFGSVTKEQR